MAKQYHTLVVKYESKANPWEIAFGDYSKAVVTDELDDMKHGFDGHTIKASKIIITSDKQSDIEQAVKKLNEG